MHRRAFSFWRVAVAAICCAALTALAMPASAAGDPRLGEQWGLSLIRAPEAWGSGTGGGITIAVVDTGVDFGHEDLNVGGKLLSGRNILNPDSPAQDDNGHGTHVAGIAAAATGNGLGIAGTAPSASILPVKVLRANGSGYARDVATGIRWAAGEGAGAPRAQVINLSLGSDLPPLAALFGSGLEEAIDYAWSRGVVVVLAAGNSFLFASSSGDVPAIVVTATNRQDERPSYASAVGSAMWGMAAPGGSASDNAGGIMSTYRPNSYRFLAGTSMAAPHVAGAAAVLRAQGFTAQQTVDRLLRTAKDIGDAGRDATFGNGRLDLGCAVGRCLNTTASTTTTTKPPASEADGTQPAGTSGSGSTPQEPSRSGSAPAPTGSSGGTAGGSGGSAAPAADSDGGAPAAPGAGGTAVAAGPTPTASSGAGSRAGANRRSGLAALLRRGGPAPAVSPTGPSEPAAPAPPTDVATGDIVPSDETGADVALDTPSSASLSSSPGGSVSNRRTSPALVATACGLLLVVAFTGLKLRRRHRTR